MPSRKRPFDLQGHRGARGLRPENTLPAFEAALDAGASSIETDLHLTRDGAVVLCHEPFLDAALFTPPAPDSPRAAVAAVTLSELRLWRADRNPDPKRFPAQVAEAGPLAKWFAERYGFDPFAVPTLADLFLFAAAYAGEPGVAAGKAPRQRERAGRVRFDLELKRVPFHPERINDGFTGRAPALLEQRLVEAVRTAGVADRTTIRSFDHRVVRLLASLEPRLTGAVIIAHTAPALPAEVALRAARGFIVPATTFWTRTWCARLTPPGCTCCRGRSTNRSNGSGSIDWGVDGITTDYPDRLAERLTAWGVAF